MRATNQKQNDKTTPAHHQPAASRKSRTALKVTSVGCAAMLAAAVLVVPTTTLAPGVEAYSDSRLASYAVGDIDTFASVIATNCADPNRTYVNKANKATTAVDTTAPAASVQPATAAAVKKTATPTATTPAKKTAAAKKAATTKVAAIAVAPKSVAAASVGTAAKKASVKSVAAAPAVKQSASSSAVSYDYDDDYDYDYNYSYYDDSSDSSYYDDDYDYSYNYDYDDDDDYSYSYYESSTPAKSSSSSSSKSSSKSSSSALISISNPDYSYSATHLSLSSYDRAKLERLVMGEAGTMGYVGCAVVAQAIRDSMVRSHTTSIDYIIDEYQYFGSTSVQPNSDVKNAVSYIFDQDGIAVQHRVMCFYIGYSAWHETQTYLTEIDGVRFFDLNVA